VGSVILSGPAFKTGACAFEARRSNEKLFSLYQRMSWPSTEKWARIRSEALPYEEAVEYWKLQMQEYKHHPGHLRMIRPITP
jgi:hypothetical protein